MPRRSPLTSACALVVSFGLLGAGAATGVTGASAARTPVATVETDPDAPADPLTVRIEEMRPAVVTGERPVRISGTVTNSSDETWTEINVLPIRSSFPITDSATLSAAAALADDAYVGDRVTDVEALDKVAELAPGESANFTATIPRRRLGPGPGVYWTGVHASGVTKTQPRDEFTDGRARTFLPVAERAATTLPTALVLPVRAPVTHTAEGQVADIEAWESMLADGGELAGLLRVAEESAGEPVTWLVDPAVLHTVARIAAGNPAWSLDGLPTPATGSPDPEDGNPPDESTAPVLPTPDTTATDQGDEDSGVSEELSGAADAWLTDFVDLLSDAEVLALPYGDVDTSALADTGPRLLRQAWSRSEQVLDALEIEATPVVTSPDGHLSPAAVESTPRDGIVLLGESALSDDEGPAPTTGTLLGHAFAASSAGIAAGGPGPEAPETPVAVRQRMVSEAVLRDLAGDPTPLVVAPPEDWVAVDGAPPLLAELGRRRFDLKGLPALVRGGGGATLGARSLVHTETQRATQVPEAQVRSAARWVGRATLLESVLTDPAGFDTQVRDNALTELSHHTRRRPRSAQARIVAGTEHVDSLLSSITITGPSSATLSGESGTIGTTVTNELTVPVTVHVDVDASQEISVEVPNPVAIPPESRRRLLLETSAREEGVKSLTLRVTDGAGSSLGGQATVQVRASEVTGLLWLIMGAGGLVLFGAIAVRWFRRGLSVRGRQPSHPAAERSDA